jgi:hypothetical protein
MVKHESSFIIAKLTSEIGIDSSYYREEPDRLYLSGVEIATIIGTGVFSSFVIGYLDGIRKGIVKHSVELGEKTVDKFVELLVRIREKIKAIDESKPQLAMKQAKECQQEIDEVINHHDFDGLEADGSESLRSSEISEIVVYLKVVGYPPDKVEERAERLADLIKQELRRERVTEN